MNNSVGSEWHRWDLHVHTASSYDSPYRGSDADELLCKTLHENGIAAVAITDHFIIDNARISNLRKISPDITFFPGVELRTDKGAANLHLILIFSDEEDLSVLADDFNAIMLRAKAKSKESNDTIYWTFEDIMEFVKNHNGLISIHAGKKTSGIDKEISNTIPFKEAVKSDIADYVDFFEVGRKQDITDYYTYVFSDIAEKPIVICSDCHDPRKYAPKECLWIKANLTFAGLKQCLYQPQERVYVGVIPPALDRSTKNVKSTIKRISSHQKENPKNNVYKWFDFDLELNSGLIAIIGNKGSGKSALSDVIGHLCKCKTMSNASFLNATRFRKPPKNYADDYIAAIQWGDSHVESMLLSAVEYPTTIEDAQYLPQKYIEDVCNDIGDEFQQEIDRVIFSYVDPTERGTASDLGELVANKSKAIELTIQKVQNEIDDLNNWIIKLEDKKTSQYRTMITDSLHKLQDTLARHDKARPVEVKKPEAPECQTDYQKKLSEINTTISTLEGKIAACREKLTIINTTIDDSKQLIAKLELLEAGVQEINQMVADFLSKHPTDTINISTTLSSPKEQILEYQKVLAREKQQQTEVISGINNSDGLLAELSKVREAKTNLISTADGEEKTYQKYLSDVAEWERERKNIIGNSTTDNTLTYFQFEIDNLQSNLEPEYTAAKESRDQKVHELFELKEQLVEVYKQIYAPVETEICTLLGGLEEHIEFNAEIQLVQQNFSDAVLAHISQKYAGIFKGRVESQNKMMQLIRATEFDKADSVIEFIHNVLVVVEEDIDSSSQKVPDKKSLYTLLHNLDYIGVSFKLKMGGRDLEELSPGERGIVLLIFYLALSQNSIPIIIDQPEDNLDNQSVYNKLVPCICAAKRKRQVIIVTHNPNIAIACDAEQIVYCNMDKASHTISYASGAIEDSITKKHVVDVLEGTMPAFNLRQKKYD